PGITSGCICCQEACRRPLHRDVFQGTSCLARRFQLSDAHNYSERLCNCSTSHGFRAEIWLHCMQRLPVRMGNSCKELAEGGQGWRVEDALWHIGFCRREGDLPIRMSILQTFKELRLLTGTKLGLQHAPVLLLFNPTTGPNAKADSSPLRFDFSAGYVCRGHPQYNSCLTHSLDL